MKESVIICGSKKYKNIYFDSLVDSFDVVVRHNWLMNINGYGKKISDLQVCNCHIYNNFVVKDYNRKYILEHYKKTKITSDYFDTYVDYLKTCKKVVYFENNNTHLLNYVPSSVVLSKQPRSGIASILQFVLLGYKPFLIGYSLFSEDFKKHATISVDINEQNKSHNLNEEIKFLIDLHNRGLVDASFCTIVDNKEDIVLDDSLIKPTTEAITFLEKIGVNKNDP